MRNFSQRAAEQLSLFDEAIPQQPVRRERKVSALQTLLLGVDWELFERNVYDLCVAAMDEVAARADGVAICQLSLLTRMHTGETIIRFETQDHGQISIEWWARQSPPVVVSCNDNPRDFVFWEFASLVHAELQALGAIDTDKDANVRRTEGWIARSLKRVARRLCEEAVLTERLPCRPFYVGISTPRDWYEVVVVLEA